MTKRSKLLVVSSMFFDHHGTSSDLQTLQGQTAQFDQPLLPPERKSSICWRPKVQSMDRSMFLAISPKPCCINLSYASMCGRVISFRTSLSCLILFASSQKYTFATQSRIQRTPQIRVVPQAISLRISGECVVWALYVRLRSGGATLARQLSRLRKRRLLFLLFLSSC